MLFSQVHRERMERERAKGDHVKSNINNQIALLTKRTQDRIQRMRDERMKQRKGEGKEEEAKKFEVLQVLNLLEKTDIHEKDLFGHPR